MLDLLYVSAFYILAIIGCLAVLAAILLLWAIYFRDLKIVISSNRAGDKKKAKNGLPQKTPQG